MKSAIDFPKLLREYGTEERCRAYLEELRWPDGPRCPRCGSERISRIRARHMFDCDSCRYQFSVRSGTVLQDSKLPLSTWFLATLLMVEAKKGISANQLRRTFGTTYRTSWYLCHRVRAAMARAQGAPLSGTVEVDETYVGGKVRGKGHGYRGNKTMVLGAVERGGDIRLRVERHGDRATLHRFIGKHVHDGARAIYTDENPAYGNLSDADTRHETVNHSAEEWVRGDVHTNTAESAWSLLKRSIVGSYHRLSAKHLPAYLGEIEWRFNNRRNPYLFRETIRALMRSDVLTYRGLIGRPA